MKLNKSIIIAGNGPSLKQIDYKRMPLNYEIFRMNNFFFEDKYYLGKDVDFYYTDFGFLHRQYFNIYNLNERKEYNIKNIYATGGTKLYSYPTVIDIQNIVYKNQQFANLITYYDKYYKQFISGGILAIFTAVVLGYTDIYLIGMDLYKTDKPYPWQQGKIFVKDFPRDREENLMNVINKHHPNFLQIKALLMAKDTKGVKLFSLSETSPINEYVNLAPIIGGENILPMDKAIDSIKDWLPLPDMDLLIQTRFKIIPRSLGLFLSCFIFKKKNRKHFRKKYVKGC
jgi:alpha-2,3 sialyltransferase